MVCFATNNQHKIEEVRALLSPDFPLVGLDEIGCYEDLPETQATLEGNSLQKAEFVFNNFKVSCFADDTGLEVTSLNGDPGVYSARYAGPQRNSTENINLLLKNLKGIANREARFRTVITLITPTVTKQFEGIVEGYIIDELRGSSGFGYDPVFIPKGFDKTLAEMTLAEKNLISHRALALQKLVGYLKASKII
ncbi:MAG: RdgB/HAM1 family non-canonical purine NTP pyrophosphatase [Cyclobacteriaceae bacterium]|nr:RdgB/HAM1 family non-canonical purine NTP pyrophosphatase [Cyclobacteriaceae bacterium]